MTSANDLTAEFRERGGEAVDVTRHGNGIRTVHVAVVFHRRPREEIGGKAAGQREVGGIQLVRRDRPEIDDVDFFLLGQIHEHEADAAEPAVPRLDRGERQAGCHGRIDGIAAGIEDFHAGSAGDPVLRGDDAAARARQRLVYLPVLDEMFGHDLT